MKFFDNLKKRFEKKKHVEVKTEAPRPKKKSEKLDSSEKSQAKARAKKAGRPYPNLVDNMAVAKKKK